MNKRILIFSLVFACFQVFSADNKQIQKFPAISENYANKIVNAINRAENSKSHPYGIVSIKIKGNNQSERETCARKICLNTVRNNWIRFNNQTKEKDFIVFLGNRYCPVGAENDLKGLNKNWIKNVKYFLAAGN